MFKRQCLLNDKPGKDLYQSESMYIYLKIIDNNDNYLNIGADCTSMIKKKNNYFNESARRHVH